MATIPGYRTDTSIDRTFISRRARTSAVLRTLNPVSRRARLGLPLAIKDQIYLARRARITSKLALAPYITRRARMVTDGLDLDYTTKPSWSFPFAFFREEIYAEGIGSIECEDLAVEELTNDYIKIKPGFFYNDYKEYFAYGDDYQSIPLVSGELSLDGRFYQFILDSGWISKDVPPTIRTTIASSQFVPTNNPVDSAEAYRKICDLSPYTESADGLSAYSFNIANNQYIIDDTGSMQYFYFPTTDTGDKYAITSDSGLYYYLPDIYEIPIAISGFLALTDEKIIITPKSLILNIPKKQYITSDTGIEAVPLYLCIIGSKGEICSDYPLLINNIQHTTTIYGTVYTSVSALRDIHIITDTGVTIPDKYDAESYNIDYVYHFERIMTTDDEMYIPLRNKEIKIGQ